MKEEFLPDSHRLLPQNIEAEAGLLGCFFLAPVEVGSMCVDNHVTSEFFHAPHHATIFALCMEFWEKNIPFDFIMVTDELKNRKTLDACGGASYITSLFTGMPTAANVAWYIDIVMEKHLARRLITVCTNVAACAYDESRSVDALLDQAERDVLSVRPSEGQATTTTAKQAVMSAIASISDAYERRGSISGIATGFSALDLLIDGLQPAQMYVFAARPSMGKTALAMNIAEFIAVELRLPVGVFSLEMSVNQLMQRMICSRARVNLASMRYGHLSERDFPAMTVAASKIGEAPMFFDDSAGLSIQEIRARARRWKNKHGIRALFVDYLQLAKSLSRRAQENRQIEVAEVSSGLKEIAKELDIPVVVLAQLKRPYGREASVRPRLSDLKESGAIEQDADLVGFISRPEMLAETPEEQAELRGVAELLIAKQRNGPLGDIALTFLKEFTRFETRAESAEEYHEEQPALAQQSAWDL